MLGSPRKLATYGKGHIRHVIVCYSQQSEYGICRIIVVLFHRCILPVGCKRILCQVVCAETQEVNMFGDLSRRKSEGHSVDERDIKKHRNDVFKLALLLPTGRPMPVAESILKDLHDFLNNFPKDSPEWESIRQASGIKNRMPSPNVLRDILSSHFVPFGQQAD